MAHAIPSSQQVAQSFLQVGLNELVLANYLLMLEPDPQYTKKTITKEQINQAMLIGMRIGISLFIGTVARKTGVLRASLKKGLEDQVKNARLLSRTFTLVFPYIALSSPPYAKYHIIGWRLNPKYSLAGYKHPTTPGTKPINPAECLHIIIIQMQKQLEQLFAGTGIDYKTVITIRGAY